MHFHSASAERCPLGNIFLEDNMTDMSQTYIRINKFFNELRFKHCFYGKNCSDTIKPSHSIQNNRVLKKISKEGEVLSFQPTMMGDAKLSEIGRKKASTFTGFCKKHDNSIFKPIEDSNDFIPGNRKQEFLYSYRALAYSHYGKKFELKVYKEILQMMEKMDDERIKKYLNDEPPFPKWYYKENDSVFSSKLAGASDAFNTLDSFRKAMNINLDKERYYKIVTTNLIFNEEFPIAVSSTLFIEYDLENNQINEYVNPNKSLIPSFLTVFPQSGKTFILFSYFKKHENQFKRFETQLRHLDIEKQKIILTNLIVNYVENFFINPDYFSSMDEKMKSEIDALYNTTIGLINKPVIIKPKANLFYKYNALPNK